MTIVGRVVVLSDGSVKRLLVGWKGISRDEVSAWELDPQARNKV